MSLKIKHILKFIFLILEDRLNCFLFAEITKEEYLFFFERRDGKNKKKKIFYNLSSKLGYTRSHLGSFTIEITDTYGNRTSDTYNVTIASSSSSLGGTTTKAALNGLATFNDITCNTAGTITITGLATGLTSTPASDSVTVATVVCYVGKTNAADDDQHGTTSSSPWTTIQYALTNVLDGATIYVNNGTYVEKIILESLNGVALTTIQGVGTSAAIITINSCLDDTILNGFIITGGNDVYGGGIYIFHSSTLLFKIIPSREIVLLMMAVVFMLTVLSSLSLGVKLRMMLVTSILFATIPLIKLPLILILITIYPIIVSTIVLVVPDL